MKTHSTTLKILSGYLTQSSGEIKINNLDIINDSNEIKKMIGYLPESNPLYNDMVVYDLLEFTANIRNINGKEFKNALDKVVQQCGLKGVLHKNIGACSKGYKQRIGLACAMIHNPKILILDEPVTGLDPNQIVEVRELIKNLGKEKLVLMSSHILQEIEATVDRIMIIDYKTNQFPPTDPMDVPETYLRQMSAYKVALEQIYPRRNFQNTYFKSAMMMNSFG